MHSSVTVKGKVHPQNQKYIFYLPAALHRHLHYFGVSFGDIS